MGLPPQTMRRAPRVALARREHRVLVVVAARLRTAASARGCRTRRRRARTETARRCGCGQAPRAPRSAARLRLDVPPTAWAPRATPPRPAARTRRPVRRARARATAAAVGGGHPLWSRTAIIRASTSAKRQAGLGASLVPHADVQVAQLLLGDGRRRVDQQVLAALRLGERDHVADLTRRPPSARPCGRGRTRCRRAAARRTAARRAGSRTSCAGPPALMPSAGEHLLPAPRGDGCAPSRRRSPSRSSRRRRPWRARGPDRSRTASSWPSFGAVNGW